LSFLYSILFIVCLCTTTVQAAHFVDGIEIPEELVGIIAPIRLVKQK